MAAYIARRWEKLPFLRFFWKNDPLPENIQNSIPKAFIASPIDVLCSNFSKFGRREIGKIAYLRKKISPRSPVLATAESYPKSATVSPRQCTQCSRFHPNRFTFSGVIFERVNTSERARQSEFNIRLKPSFESNKYYVHLALFCGIHKRKFLRDAFHEFHFFLVANAD